MAEAPKRLSIFRLFLSLVVVAGISTGVYFGMLRWQDTRASADTKPWFAAYVDVTATPAYQFEQLGSTSYKDVVLSFIVASPDNACTPTWGSAYTLDQASEKLDLDRRIARLRQQDGSVAISFGGVKNDELAVGCTDEAALKKAYEQVIDRYEVDTIDLDLELQGLTNLDAAKRRAKVIAQIQQQKRNSGKKLAVWVTLPVAPTGLTEDGTNGVSELLKGGVDLAGVNLLTMDYGGALTSDLTVETASENALTKTHRQLGILYEQNGINLSDHALWLKLGATPMIGQNDIAEEVFTPEDAVAFNKFALSKGIWRMSMWSANRDIKCGSNYVDVKIVSTSCSGVSQSTQEFAQTLSQGFPGRMSLSASLITTPDQGDNAQQEPDDPSNSPYQIWDAAGAYLKGTKVVWHHNVYVAKWWTHNDLPDSPVLQEWQTPWELVGPVLPGEKPIDQATLPEGTYPEWNGKKDYEKGDRVMFDGSPYEAKWWNNGDSPALASSNADSSPWVPLTQEQINEVIKK